MRGGMVLLVNLLLPSSAEWLMLPTVNGTGELSRLVAPRLGAKVGALKMGVIGPALLPFCVRSEAGEWHTVDTTDLRNLMTGHAQALPSHRSLRIHFV